MVDVFVGEKRLLLVDQALLFQVADHPFDLLERARCLVHQVLVGLSGPLLTGSQSLLIPKSESQEHQRSYWVPCEFVRPSYDVGHSAMVSWTWKGPMQVTAQGRP